MPDKFNILNGKNILVTGGAGAIGSNLVRFLSNYKCKIIVLDDLSSGFRENVPHKKNVIFYEDSILNDEILKRVFKHRVDYIFHLAAHFANQNSIEYPCEDLLTNALGTLKLLEYANRHSASRFVYASSSCVYGATNKKMSEDLITRLETPYAISKLTAEEYVHFYHRHYGMNITAVRYFNAYGPYDPPGKYRSVIPNFFLKALKRQPLPIMGTGQEIRDFTFMDDIVRGTVLTLTTDISIGQVYNIGTGIGTKVIDLAKTINNITGSPGDIKFILMRKWDNVKRRLADINKSKEHIGYKPSVSLEDGLRRTWEWFRGKYKK